MLVDISNLQPYSVVMGQYINNYVAGFAKRDHILNYFQCHKRLRKNNSLKIVKTG